MGVKKGQLPISLKVATQKLQICKEIIFHKKFNTVTHLGQITNFDPFGAYLDQMQVKKIKNCQPCKKSLRKTENFDKQMDISL